uniref:Uncharacterized protein n=1 Tax=Amphimedon queenslandica TaxID=400682 RepID=A0A1X7TPM3_AMPQE
MTTNFTATSCSCEPHLTKDEETREDDTYCGTVFVMQKCIRGYHGKKKAKVLSEKIARNPPPKKQINDPPTSSTNLAYDDSEAFIDCEEQFSSHSDSS